MHDTENMYQILVSYNMQGLWDVTNVLNQSRVVEITQFLT
jgi:hypothetical protein